MAAVSRKERREERERPVGAAAGRQGGGRVAGYAGEWRLCREARAPVASWAKWAD
jgi:hypothetical protein